MYKQEKPLRRSETLTNRSLQIVMQIITVHFYNVNKICPYDASRVSLYVDGANEHEDMTEWRPVTALLIISGCTVYTQNYTNNPVIYIDLSPPSPFPPSLFQLPEKPAGDFRPVTHKECHPACLHQVKWGDVTIHREGREEGGEGLKGGFKRKDCVWARGAIKWNICLPVFVCFHNNERALQAVWALTTRGFSEITNYEYILSYIFRIYKAGKWKTLTVKLSLKMWIGNNSWLSAVSIFGQSTYLCMMWAVSKCPT